MRKIGKISVLAILGMLVGMGLSGAILVIMPGDAQAHFIENGSPVVLSGTGSATIDGIIDPIEWSNAGSISFTLLDFLDGNELKNYPIGPSPLSGTLYVMNDELNLYVGATFDDVALTSDDDFSISFDDDHDGLLEAFPPYGYPTNGGGEDCLAVRGSGALEDSYIVSPLGTYITSAFDPVSTDLAGAFSRVGSLSHFELSHPLDSTDDNHDFSLSAGDTIGFTIGYHDDAIGELHVWPTWVYGTCAGLSPPLSGFQNATDFGDIVISGFNPEDAIEDIDDYIRELPESAFENNAEQHKNALYEKLIENEEGDAILQLIEAGLYQEALEKLQNDIRPKCDGDPSPPDWITDPTAQEELLEMIDALIEYLESLI